MALIPPDHPLRLVLHNEVHARPTEPVVAPARVRYLAVLSSGDRRDTDWTAVRAMLQRLGQEVGAAVVDHVAISVGAVRLVIERHSEFIRFMLVSDVTTTASEVEEKVRRELAALPGQTLVACDVDVRLPGTSPPPPIEQVAEEAFGANSVVVAATLADGGAVALTDFRIGPEGISRIVLRVDRARPRQTGRLIQRLLEIDTYRMMALLALPAARALRPQIERMERELAAIVSGIAGTDAEGEAALLNRLTELEARVQQALAEQQYRFSASDAYHRLVDQRVADLREQRIEGLQTFGEFTGRRLAPAVATCKAVSANLHDLSNRIARATDLLATRVQVERERQNRALLAATARRARLQLHLQRTVEGLSIVAISYYAVGLAAYLLKGAKSAGLPVDVDIATGLLVPACAAAVALGLGQVVGRIRARSSRTTAADSTDGA